MEIQFPSVYLSWGSSLTSSTDYMIVRRDFLLTRSTEQMKVRRGSSLPDLTYWTDEQILPENVLDRWMIVPCDHVCNEHLLLNCRNTRISQLCTWLFIVDVSAMYTVAIVIVLWIRIYVWYVLTVFIFLASSIRLLICDLEVIYMSWVHRHPNVRPSLVCFIITPFSHATD